MNYKFCLSFFALLFLFNTAYGWGDKGHALIARKAVELLPEEMNNFKEWGEYIEDHSSDPDKRKKEDPTEDPKHYIDIDYYREFRNGEMIYDKEILTGIYGDSIVTEYGVLPWATVEAYNSLVQALKDRNRDRILIYASDLAHYVADGHQPMHTVLNYDGQHSGQKGIHARYEIHMVDRYLDELENAFYKQSPFVVEDPLKYVFHYITTANIISESVFHSDLVAYGQTGSWDSDDYYKILWFRTKYITSQQMNNAAKALASLIYTAWNNAGKPDLNNVE
jgi:hypothetical protein